MALAGDAPDGLQAQEHAGPLRTAKRRTAIEIFDEPMVAGRNAMVRDENEARWDSWFELRYLAREKARLEGESARIAEENERQRRQRAELDRTTVREATTPEEIASAVAKANSVDAPFAECPLEAAKRWAESDVELTREAEDEFDETVDLEAKSEPGELEPPVERLRVMRVNRVRHRVRN